MSSCGFRQSRYLYRYNLIHTISNLLSCWQYFWCFSWFKVRKPLSENLLLTQVHSNLEERFNQFLKVLSRVTKAILLEETKISFDVFVLWLVIFSKGIFGPRKGVSFWLATIPPVISNSNLLKKVDSSNHVFSPSCLLLRDSRGTVHAMWWLRRNQYLNPFYKKKASNCATNTEIPSS